MPKRFSAPSRRLAFTGFALIALTIVAAGLAIFQRHEEAITRYRQELTKLSVVLAEQTARSLQSIDLVLQEIQTRAAALGLDDPDQYKRQMNSVVLHQFMSERSKVLPQSKAIGLVSADGRLINGSNPSAAEGRSVAAGLLHLSARSRRSRCLHQRASAQPERELDLLPGAAHQRSERCLCRCRGRVG